MRRNRLNRVRCFDCAFVFPLSVLPWARERGGKLRAVCTGCALRGEG